MDEGGGFLVLIIAIILLAAATVVLYDMGYEDGQVDALTGTIRYELVTQPDSSRVWKEIE